MNYPQKPVLKNHIPSVHERKKPFNSHICDANLYKKLSGQITLHRFMKERSLLNVTFEMLLLQKKSICTF